MYMYIETLSTCSYIPRYSNGDPVPIARRKNIAECVEITKVFDGAVSSTG